MDTAIPSGLATATTSTSLESTNKGDQQKSQFLKLLVAQLKGQNPLDPKDGTEFISQLAQFSSLEELINIRTALEQLQNTTQVVPENPFSRS
jgi:flagellar basal-body rod modification protein FlgD